MSMLVEVCTSANQKGESYGVYLEAMRVGVRSLGDDPTDCGSWFAFTFGFRTSAVTNYSFFFKHDLRISCDSASIDHIRKPRLISTAADQ